MAVCDLCGEEMTEEKSCRPDPLVIGGMLYEPIRWKDERRMTRIRLAGACPDCGVPSGGVHHHGCDMEECPSCHAQAIGCDCQWEIDCSNPTPPRRCSDHAWRPR